MANQAQTPHDEETKHVDARVATFSPRSRRLDLPREGHEVRSKEVEPGGVEPPSDNSPRARLRAYPRGSAACRGGTVPPSTSHALDLNVACVTPTRDVQPIMTCWPSHRRRRQHARWSFRLQRGRTQDPQLAGRHRFSDSMTGQHAAHDSISPSKPVGPVVFASWMVALSPPGGHEGAA